MIKEFREFALKGSVVDMAVGIIIGAAFGAVVSSFVSDVLLPPLGLLLGGVDFSSLYVLLAPGTPAGPLRLSGSSPGGRRGNPELRPVRQPDRRFPHRGLRPVPRYPEHQ